MSTSRADQHALTLEETPWPTEEHIDNGVKCKACGIDFLHWRRIPSHDSGKLHWRLFNDAGERHYCNRFDKYSDRLNDGI